MSADLPLLARVEAAYKQGMRSALRDTNLERRRVVMKALAPIGREIAQEKKGNRS